jgi:hypothetical protein
VVKGGSNDKEISVAVSEDAKDLQDNTKTKVKGNGADLQDNSKSKVKGDGVDLQDNSKAEIKGDGTDLQDNTKTELKDQGRDLQDNTKTELSGDNKDLSNKAVTEFEGDGKDLQDNTKTTFKRDAKDLVDKTKIEIKAVEKSILTEVNVIASALPDKPEIKAAFHKILEKANGSDHGGLTMNAAAQAAAEIATLKTETEKLKNTIASYKDQSALITKKLGDSLEGERKLKQEMKALELKVRSQSNQALNDRMQKEIEMLKKRIEGAKIKETDLVKKLAAAMDLVKKASLNRNKGTGT